MFANGPSPVFVMSLIRNYNYDPYGKETIFTYDLTGNLIKETNAKNNETLYTYNADNTISKITYPDGSTTEFTYDKLGNLLTNKDQRGNITSYTYDGFGNIKTNTDSYGNVTKFEYDENSNLLKVIDPKNNETLSTYDKNNQLIQTKLPLEMINGEIIYAIKEYEYDVLGNLTKLVSTGTKDLTAKREVYYTYYDNNLIETVSNNSGAYTKNFYDKNGNLIKNEILRDTGIYDISKYVYDNQDRLIKKIALVDESDIYNANNYPNIQNIRDSEYPGKLQLITENVYDILGSLTKVITSKAFQYLETDTIIRDKYTVWYSYDLLNRPDETTWIHNNQTVYNKNYYDEIGNIIKVRNKKGYYATYSFNNMNRLTKVEGPLAGYKITFRYDLAGNKISETNSKNNTMTYTYDKLNRLETIIDPYGVIINKNIYDENGNVTKVIDAKGYISASTDEGRYGTEYTYDIANRLVTVVDPEIAELNDPSKYTVKYEYNQFGETTKVIDALGYETNYEYDNSGNLTKVIDAKNIETKFTYDKQNNKLSMTDGRNNQKTYLYGV